MNITDKKDVFCSFELPDSAQGLLFIVFSGETEEDRRIVCTQKHSRDVSKKLHNMLCWICLTTPRLFCILF